MREKRRVALEVMGVREPCQKDWDGMTGDDRVRFCAGCNLHVHNLSAMTRREAERLVCERAGRLCVRFEQGADGIVRTLDYEMPPPARRTWRFWSVIGGVGAGMAAVLHLAMARPGAPPPPPPAGPVAAAARTVMGDFAVIPARPPAATQPVDAPVAVTMGTVCPAPVKPQPVPPGGADWDQLLAAKPR